MLFFLSSPHISTVQVHSPDKTTEEADATLKTSGAFVKFIDTDNTFSRRCDLQISVCVRGCVLVQLSL